jgi:hypothetical protein
MAIMAILESYFIKLEHIWHDSRTEKVVASLLVLVFLITLALVELKRHSLLPSSFTDTIPGSHYFAISVSFSLLLAWEVIGLIFSITRSMSDAVGKQFEILSLILLRKSFKHTVEFPEPIIWKEITEPVLHILSDASGALIIFALLFVYYRIQRYQLTIQDEDKKAQFVRIKRVIAMGLLMIFTVVGTYYMFENVFHGGDYIFFDTFYTVLIFSDILIVLISLRYTSTFHIVFRNSAFAVTTLIIRMALTAPVYIDVLLGIFSIAYAIGLVFLHNMWVKTYQSKEDYIATRT